MNDAPHEQIRHFQSPRLDSVRRQVDARLAAGHHVLLFGPPSGGKSFLVDRILASGRLGPTIEADAGHDSDSALVSSVAVTGGDSRLLPGPFWKFAQSMAEWTGGPPACLRLREAQHVGDGGAGGRALTHVTDRSTRRFPLPDGSALTWEPGAGLVIAESNGRPQAPQLLDRFGSVYVATPPESEIAAYLVFLGMERRPATALAGIVACRNRKVIGGQVSGTPTSLRGLKRVCEMVSRGLRLWEAAVLEIVPDAEELRELGEDVPELAALQAALGRS